MREAESLLDWRVVRAMVPGANVSEAEAMVSEQVATVPASDVMAPGANVPGPKVMAPGAKASNTAWKATGVGLTADRVSEPEESDDAHPEHPSHSPPPDIGVYVNPFTDFGFKRIFGQPMSRDILIDFLNEVLAGREATITEVTYLNNEQVPGQKDQRRAAFDLHCTTSTGARIIVEMQASYQRHVVERALYYATFAITEQAPRGDWNFRFDRIYSIVIMDFDLPASALGDSEPPADSRDSSINPHNEVRHEVMLVNTETGRIMSDRLVLIFLEMRNFVKSEEELETNMDKWLYLLRHLGRLTSMPAALQGRIFKEIFTIAKVSAMDTQEYIAYQRSIKSYRDIKSGEISSYELGLEKGVESIIKNMHKNGAGADAISAMTGIELAKIESILSR